MITCTVEIKWDRNKHNKYLSVVGVKSEISITDWMNFESVERKEDNKFRIAWVRPDFNSHIMKRNRK